MFFYIGGLGGGGGGGGVNTIGTADMFSDASFMKPLGTLAPSPRDDGPSRFPRKYMSAKKGEKHD